MDLKRPIKRQRKVRISMTISTGNRDALFDYAYKSNLSMSEVLEKYIDKNKETWSLIEEK